MQLASVPKLLTCSDDELQGRVLKRAHKDSIQMLV